MNTLTYITSIVQNKISNHVTTMEALERNVIGTQRRENVFADMLETLNSTATRLMKRNASM